VRIALTHACHYPIDKLPLLDYAVCMQIEDILKQIGLREEEIKVFIECGKGFFKASEIAKRTDLKRTHVYSVLDSLIDKELIIEIKNRNVKKFRAVSPSRIHDFIEKRKMELDGRKKVLNHALNNLKSAFQIKQRANIEFFNGIEETRKLYSKLNEKQGDIELKIITPFMRYAMFGDTIDKKNNEAEKKFTQYRRNKRDFIKTRILIPDTEKSRDIIEHQLSKHPTYLEVNDFRTVDFNNIPLQNNIFLRETDVSIITATESETWAMRLFEKSSLNTFNAIFESLWQSGRAYKSET
jgi:sugar-specific transcriptional regulator TrmB